MDNYKGIYYKETKEQKYYEGGAHFPYKVLFNILLNLGGTLSQDEYINNRSDKSKDTKVMTPIKIIENPFSTANLLII